MPDRAPGSTHQTARQGNEAVDAGERVRVLDVRVGGEMKGDFSASDASFKDFGDGSPLIMTFVEQDGEQQVVVHTLAQEFNRPFGLLERVRSLASNVLRDGAPNREPRDGVIAADSMSTGEGDLLSPDELSHFIALPASTNGQLYAEDLKQIAAANHADLEDERRVRILARYAASIHAWKQPAPALYKRCIRDLIGFGTLGIIDLYPGDSPLVSSARLEAIEQRSMRWRWQLNGQYYRLSQVHGDFHPWNVQFENATASYSSHHPDWLAWGEPADDVSAMTMHYLLVSLYHYGTLTGPFRRLFRLFWDDYLERTGDEEMLAVIPPFYARLALIMAQPGEVPDGIRDRLFRFLETVLEVERFEPARLDEYLG